MYKRTILLGILVSVVVVGSFVARAVVSNGAIPFQRLDLNVTDLVAAAHLNIYKYRLRLQPGQRFKVILREQRSADAGPRILFEHSFVRDDAPDATMRISFLRRDNKFAGVLLSGEKDAHLDIWCEGCTSNGLGTIVPVPLSDIRTGIVLRSHHSESHRIKAENGEAQLLSLFPSTSRAAETSNPNFPRAELVIVRVD